MKIKNFKLAVWIEPTKEITDREIEELLSQVETFIKSGDYRIPEDFCGANPTLHITKEKSK